MRRSRAPIGCLVVVALACGLRSETNDHDSAGGKRSVRAESSPNARPELVSVMREDLRTERHPGDGGGSAWFDDPQPESGPAGSPGRWRIVFEVGPLGIAEGGWVYLQVPPFWGWDTPQAVDSSYPGFTLVTSESEGVELQPRTVDAGLLGVEVLGRSLAEGELIVFDYGQGELGARRDRYSEHKSSFFLSVDADGDGVRGLITDQPTVDILPGSPALLSLTVPSTLREGERPKVALAVLDGAGNAGVSYEGAFEVGLQGVEITTVELRAESGGTAQFEVPQAVLTGEETVLRLQGQSDSLSAVSNPLVIDSGPRILWGDLHGHSQISDGTGTPNDYFRYARDVAALDVVALTDHDHWGMEPLSTHPELWQSIVDASRDFHQPGEFVTLLGYEWTSWVHGHRHVLYFEDQGQVFSSVDPAYESPEQLWEALRGRPALTFAHHSAGGPIATNWTIPPDPVLEPVTEIVSVHGSSEAPDSPSPIYSPISGNWVRDALARGYQLGFIGSGDSHDGHPGLAHLASGSGGLAAILSEDRTREGVLDALRARRVYATNGPRIVVRSSLDGMEMGSEVTPRRRANWQVQVHAVAPIERVDLVRNGAVVETIRGDPGTEVLDLGFERSLRRLQEGETLYLRVVQSDGGAAWSSPYFVGVSHPGEGGP